MTYPREVQEGMSQFGFFDHFAYFVDGDLWTILDADTGATVTIDADGVGGIIDLTTGATDNNEVGIFTTNELFKLAAGKPIKAGARIKYTEAQTDDANIYFGFMDAGGADLVTDVDTLAINDTGFGICKLSGDTTWRGVSQVNGGTANNTLSGTGSGGGVWQTLYLETVVVDGSVDQYEIIFKVNELQLRTNDSYMNRIKHKVSYTTVTEMDFGLYCKVGSANAETINVDYLWAYQTI